MSAEKIILLIEDSREDAFLIERRLREYMTDSFRILHAGTMKEALAMIQENEDDIDLILLDMQLPDTQSGKDSFLHIKPFIHDIPVVVLTGVADHDLALGLVKEGAEDFLNKSLLSDHPTLIKKALDYALCRHERHGEIRKRTQDTIHEKDQIISWMSGSYTH